jgi:hypothetical protein
MRTRIWGKPKNVTMSPFNQVTDDIGNRRPLRLLPDDHLGRCGSGAIGAPSTSNQND